jgi:hypothetical protein
MQVSEEGKSSSSFCFLFLCIFYHHSWSPNSLTDEEREGQGNQGDELQDLSTTADRQELPDLNTMPGIEFFFNLLLLSDHVHCCFPSFNLLPIAGNVQFWRMILLTAPMIFLILILVREATLVRWSQYFFCQ